VLGVGACDPTPDNSTDTTPRGGDQDPHRAVARVKRTKKKEFMWVRIGLKYCPVEESFEKCDEHFQSIEVEVGYFLISWANISFSSCSMRQL
jgi:hypothetical protein